MLDQISEARLAFLDRLRCDFRIADVADHPENLVLYERIDCAGEPHRLAIELERIFDLDFSTGAECFRDRREGESSNRSRKHILNAPSDELVARPREKFIISWSDLLVCAIAIDHEEHFSDRVEQSGLLGRLFFHLRASALFFLDCSS